jgi:predicted ribosomally synthesized peptide with SipW-like signal peptide
MNMKRIISSGVMLVALLALVAGGTGAFFSDTETSTGNVFTAGAVDLKVDHTRQTYNGVDCQTCGVTIYSSTSTKVVSANASASYQGPFPVNAQLIANPNPAWLPEASVVPAEWIWVTPIVSGSDTTNNAEYTFEDSFFLQGPIALTNFSLSLASDNGYRLVVNGNEIVNALNSEFTYSGLNPLSGPQQAAFQSALIQNGQNTVQITVRNKADNPNPNSNPAGLIYKIVFTNQNCQLGVADFQLMCQLWNAKDLTNEKFFNFSDVKPQDTGSNLISLHVDSNEAYMCLRVTNKNDLENTNIDPEVAAGDTTTPAGEMGDYLMVAGWYSDANGTKSGLMFGPTDANDLDAITYADSGTGTPVAPGTTKYVQLEWCMGDMTLSGLNSSVVSCNGNVPNINQSQTDAFLADLQFYAVQTRNNGNFRCNPQELVRVIGSGT